MTTPATPNDDLTPARRAEVIKLLREKAAECHDDAGCEWQEGGSGHSSWVAGNRFLDAAALLEADGQDTARLRAAVLWALGEDGDFPVPEGVRAGRDPITDKRVGLFWWRTELRKRAALDAARQAPAPEEGRT